MRWAEILVEVQAESCEAVTAILLEIGCKGVAQKLEPIAANGQWPVAEPHVPAARMPKPHEVTLLTGYLPVSDELGPAVDIARERLSRLAEYGLSAPESVTLRTVEDADWATEWKKHFKPLRIGKRLVIKPTWETWESAPGDVVVEIDPGMAFGTGGHGTTRLCLLLLDELVQPGWTVADIGTGSGILSLAAARLGASKVHATDIDLLPRKVSRQNVGASGLDSVVTVHEMADFDAAAVECNLVVANIIADAIIEIAPSVLPRLLPGGIFVSSGIIDDRVDDVVCALMSTGFQVVDVREDEAWRAVVARKPIVAD